MANENVPDTVCDTQASELRITVQRDVLVRFEGTAAQLIEEGLIPSNFELPRASSDKIWAENGLIFWLRRARPSGHKGPMRSWLDMDNWVVRVDVAGRDSRWYDRRNVERKAEELREAVRRQSPAGLAACEAKLRRYWEAKDDKAFQAFKALIPGLVPAKRARKSKSKTAVGG